MTDGQVGQLVHVDPIVGSWRVALAATLHLRFDDAACDQSLDCGLKRGALDADLVAPFRLRFVEPSIPIFAFIAPEHALAEHSRRVQIIEDVQIDAQHGDDNGLTADPCHQGLEVS